MTGSPRRRHQHTFLVRLWQETDQLEPGQWRGSIEHLSTRLRMYFATPADLSDFITLTLQRLPCEGSCDGGVASSDEVEDKGKPRPQLKVE